MGDCPLRGGLAAVTSAWEEWRMKDMEKPTSGHVQMWMMYKQAEIAAVSTHQHLVETTHKFKTMPRIKHYHMHALLPHAVTATSSRSSDPTNTRLNQP